MAVVGTITGLIAGLLVADGSSAALANLNFEIEGNLVLDDAAATPTHVDWVTAASGATPSLVCDDPTTTATNEALNCGLDKPTGQQDDSFGNGTKEDTPVPSVIDGSIPNNKSDLTRFYVAANKETIGAAAKDMLYLAWERVQEPSGTTNMDFEFNQSQTTSGNGVTPVRTGGDLLIKFDLSQGGTNPTFGLHKWQTGSGDYANGCEAASRYPCWGPVQQLSASNARGAVNTQPATDPINPGQPRTLSPRTFGEAAINLTDSGVLGSGCTSYGSAYLKSRSSDSFTAAVKDFIAPIPVSVTNCQPATIKLKKVKADGSTPLAGAKFKLYEDDNNNGVVDAPDDAQVGAECTTAVTGSATDGVCSWSVSVGGDYVVVETAAPAGYQPITTPINVPTVTITSAAQVVDLGSVTNNPAPISITISKTDDAATPVAVGGALFRLYNQASGGGIGTVIGDGTAANPYKQCTTATSGASLGSCQITGIGLGSYVIHEESAPTGYQLAADQSFSVAEGQTTSSFAAFTFVDKRTFKVIVLVCQESNSQLYASSVSINGETAKTSLGHTGAAGADTLCSTGGATFGGLVKNLTTPTTDAYAGSVRIQ